MSDFVLDASMTMAWHFADEESSRSLAVERRTDEDRVIVPGHWFVEIANGLISGERRKRATLAESVEFVRYLAALDVEVDETMPELVWTRVLPLARAHGLTVYDALYLELAERRGLPLASFDADLNDAARRIGIELVEEHA